MEEFNNQLIVVAGCQRSGTTLAGQVLGVHSKLFLIDERDGLYNWFMKWREHRKDSQQLLDETIVKAAQKYNDNRSSFVKSIDLKEYGVVLKAPNLSYQYEELLLIAPRPIIVFPVRDARSVVASMIKLPHIVVNQAKRLKEHPVLSLILNDEIGLLESDCVEQHVKAAIIWRIKTGMYDEFVKRELPVMVFRYEELVQEPSKTCLKFADHCSVDFEQSMLSHHEYLRGVTTGKTMRDRSIDLQSLSRWENELSTRQVDEVLEISNVLMTKLGYTA